MTFTDIKRRCRTTPKALIIWQIYGLFAPNEPMSTNSVHRAFTARTGHPLNKASMNRYLGLLVDWGYLRRVEHIKEPNNLKTYERVDP